MQIVYISVLHFASVEKYGKRMTVVTMQIRVTLHSSDEILESFSLIFPRDDLKRR